MIINSLKDKETCIDHNHAVSQVGHTASTHKEYENVNKIKWNPVPLRILDYLPILCSDLGHRYEHSNTYNEHEDHEPNFI